MLIFWRLMFGHLLADFTFQTDFINHWKRTSLWGMLAHCGFHPLCYAVLTWEYLPDPWVSTPWFDLTGWACVLIIFVSHFLEDEWRVFTIFRFKTPDNTVYFLWDQLIHYAVIFAVIPMGLASARDTGFFPERWPVLGCLFVLVTHAATVLVYFIDKDRKNRPFPGFQEKYLGMGERLVLALTFLVPGSAYLILAPVWLAFMYGVRARRFLDLTWLSYYLGGGLTVLCGLAGRYIYYA